MIMQIISQGRICEMVVCIMYFKVYIYMYIFIDKYKTLFSDDSPRIKGMAQFSIVLNTGDSIFDSNYN